MYSQAGIKLETSNIASSLQTVKKYVSRLFPVLFMNTSFLMIKSQGLTNRKDS
jgi:hypothetical protein